MRKLILSIIVTGLLATNTMAGTNTGRTCCCAGAAKRYHTEAKISEHYIHAYYNTAYGGKTYTYPIYKWRTFDQRNGHICYSTVTSHVSISSNDAIAQRGPDFNYQKTSITNASYRGGEGFSYVANEEFDINQYSNGFSKSELAYKDVRFENGLLIIDSLNGFNHVSKSSIFESMTRIVVFNGKIEDLDQSDGINYGELNIIYETSLFVTKDGVSGTGFLHDDYQNGLAQINDSTVGVSYYNYNKVYNIPTNLPDDSITVLVITDDGISKNKLLELHQFTPPNANKKTTQESNFGKKQDKTSISIFPNPAKNMLFFSVYENQANEGVITIKDVAGKAVFTKSYQFKEGFNKDQIDVNLYNNGIYTLELIVGGHYESQKIQIAN